MSPTSYQAAPPRARIIAEAPGFVKRGDRAPSGEAIAHDPHEILVPSGASFAPNKNVNSNNWIKLILHLLVTEIFAACYEDSQD